MKEMWLREIKGGPVTVLLALWAYGPGNKQHVMRYSGFKKDTVTDALQYLEDLGYVERPHYRKWQVASSFYQLPLPFAEAYQLMLAATQPEQIEGEVVAAERRKNRLSEQPETQDIELVENPERRKNRSSNAEKRKNRSSALVSSSSTTNYKNKGAELLEKPDNEILKICAEVGIFGKKRELLAKMPHVIEGGADYIHAHIRNVGNRDIGLAIWRMEQGWANPKNAKSKRNGNGLSDLICPNCSCSICMCEMT